MILGGVFFLEIRNIQPKKVLIIAALIVVAFIFGVTLSQSVKNSTAQENYQHAVKNTYQSVADVKYILQNIADNLNIQNSDQNNFLQALENSKEILANENKNLNQLEVPAEYSDVHKKIIDCLKTEYNLLDRLKENFAIQNEYEAAENFVKSKELFTNLKEQSAFLMVKGIDFEEVFDLSAVSEKLEKYFSAKKQARYEKDQKEQEEREKAAAAERERIEREKQKKFHKTLTMTAEEFRNFYNQNASALPEGDKIKITGVQSDFIPFDKSYVYIFYNKSGFDLVETSYENRVDGFLIANRTSASNYSGNFFWTMLVAAHTLCNENFISNVEDLKEIKQVIVMLMNRINKNNTEVSTYYNGKKFTFCKSSDESLFIVGN